MSYVELAGVNGTGNDPSGARDQYRKALAIREELLQQDPGNALARQGLASVLSRLGTADSELGDHQAGLAHLARAEGLLREGDKERLTDLRSRQAVVHQSMGQIKEALKDARSAVDGRRSVLKAAPDNVLPAQFLARELLILGNILTASGTADGSGEACVVYAEALRGIGEIERRQSNPNASLRPLRESAEKALASCALLR